MTVSRLDSIGRVTLVATRTPSLVYSIAGATALVGVLDLADAILFNASLGVAPLRVMQSIASGLLGRSAYDGGWVTGALGVGLHFLIAGAVAGVFAFASRRWPALWRRPIVFGALYGLAMFLVMYRVVLPIAGLDAWPRRWPGLLNALGAHVFAVGLPVALWNHRLWSGHRNRAPAP